MVLIHNMPLVNDKVLSDIANVIARTLDSWTIGSYIAIGAFSFCIILIAAFAVFVARKN